MSEKYGPYLCELKFNKDENCNAIVLRNLNLKKTYIFNKPEEPEYFLILYLKDNFNTNIQ